ncbi:MAG TPA: diguanylate cyclase [Devosia sp.]|nr:diguanylate cyclase [Devosia sp.]
MTSPLYWHALIENLAVVALFISAWMQARFLLAGLERWKRDLIFGVAMGLAAVASMLLAIPLENSYFDLRLSVLAIAGFFGGPVAGAAAAAFAIGYRCLIIGGPYAIPAAVGICVAVLIGVGVSAATYKRLPPVLTTLILAIAVGIANVGLGFLFGRSAAALQPLTLAVGAMNAAATAISVFFMMRYRVIERERDLLRQAFFHSPDLQYVKTPDHKFVAANINFARIAGFSDPSGLLGKSEFDLVEPERAARMIAAETALLEGGPPIVDSEEVFVGPQGEKSWYLTSKVALRDESGKIIGTSGITRDVTVRRRLRDEAEEARNRLDFLLAGLSDGIAMFDPSGKLVYCNEQYRQVFPRTAEIRQPGRHIRDILRAVAQSGEQKGIPVGHEEEWVERIVATLRTAGDQEVELWDGRWVQIKTRPTDDGTALIVVSDITTLKKTEAALREATEQLKLLASTDGLTGLLNRRAFDSALADEVSRARRAGLPLSVMLSDVDRFKAYNDLYGHQAGDDALKAVGQCLREAIKRPGDVAARYGGEEFVAILPNTDAAGAAFLADSFRERLGARAIEHKTSEHGTVTVSVGVTTLEPGPNDTTIAELLRRADEALYAAKAAGRDRVVIWSAPEGRPQAAAAQ